MHAMNVNIESGRMFQLLPRKKLLATFRNAMIIGGSQIASARQKHLA
jgi:hypothetical protein